MRDDILNTIWKRTGPGHVFLPRRNALTNEWNEAQSLVAPLRQLPAQHEPWDQYYTPITYAVDVRTKGSIDRWGVLYADLDDAFDGAILSAMPATLLVESSPGNFQAVWFLTEPVSVELGAELNRRLAHLIQADHGAWIPTKVLRVPESINYKRGGVPVEVRKWDPEVEYDPGQLFLDLPVVRDRTVSEGGTVPAVPSEDEWRDLLRKYWPKFDHRTRLMLGQAQVIDRSFHLTRLANSMATISIPPEDIFRLLSRLPANKFRGRPEVLWRSIVLTAGG